jgi:hypothetical protein
MKAYQPYIEEYRRHSGLFDDSRDAQTLSPAEIHCPGFSYSIFEHCMTYAMKKNWGRTLGL